MNPNEDTSSSGQAKVEPQQETPHNQAEVSGPAPEAKGPKGKALAVAGIVLALALVVGGGWYWYQSTKPAPQVTRVVKVGVLEPLTGDNITVGNDRKRAIDLARKDLNLQNVDIQLVYKDSNCDAATAVPAFKNLVSQDKVVAVIGDDCSTSTLEVAKIAETDHVVVISPAATSPSLSSAGDYIFRTVPSDSQQGQFAAALLYKHGYRKLAVLHEDGAYGEGLAGSLNQNFAAAGGRVADTQVFKQASVDVATQVQHIKATNPDVIYIISGDLNSDTAIMLELKKQGLKAALFGSEAMVNTTFIKDAGDAAEGLTLTSLTDGTKSFKEKYRAEYNTDAGDYIAQTYDAYTALALTIKNGASTGDQIKAALYSLSFDGASQPIKFDHNGDVPGTYIPVVVQHGQFAVSQ